MYSKAKFLTTLCISLTITSIGSSAATMSSSSSPSSSIPGPSPYSSSSPSPYSATANRPPPTSSKQPPRPLTPPSGFQNRQTQGLAPTAVQDLPELYPGLVGLDEGEWIVGDNLLNLSNNIAISVHIVRPPLEIELPPEEKKEESILFSEEEVKQQEVVKKPEKAPAPSTPTPIKPVSKPVIVTKDQIYKIVATIFRDARISPIGNTNGPKLPSFQIQILMYPLGTAGYAVYCEGSLYESVYLDRFHPDRGTFMQAITWQSKKLFITPKNQATKAIEETIAEITKSFVDRYDYFLIRNK